MLQRNKGALADVGMVVLQLTLGQVPADAGRSLPKSRSSCRILGWR